MGVTIWSGLYLGAIYALVATGFTISMVPTGVFNFAQGAIVVLGTFMVYQLMTVSGVPRVWAILLTALAGAITGILCEVLTVRSLRLLGGLVDNALVTTVGASTAIIGLIGVKWGYVPIQIPFVGPSNYVHFLGISAEPVQIAVVAAAIISAVTFECLFRYTRRGQACLAVAEDRDPATLRGINVSRMSLVAFTVAGAFGGLVGLLIGPITYGDPTLGATLALDGFVAVALGGEGSFVGGLLGGLVVGLVSTFAVRYLGASYGDLAVLALLLATLGLRPKGLGGIAQGRAV
jgi:branched-chain amino acid transport system permease protein